MNQMLKKYKLRGQKEQKEQKEQMNQTNSKEGKKEKKPKKVKAKRKDKAEKAPKAEKAEKAEKRKEKKAKKEKIVRTKKKGKKASDASQKKNIKKLGNRVLLIILPVVTIGMVVLTVISVQFSGKNLESSISNRMQAELQVQVDKVSNYFTRIIDIADTLETTVSQAFQQVDQATYEQQLIDIVTKNDIVLGSGIWFEPNVYNAEQQYMGLYAQRKDGKIEINDDYNTDDNGYFKQNFYNIAKTATDVVLIEPFYDLTLRCYKVTAVVPMYQGETFIGCVTVDVSLDSIIELIEGIQIGEHAKATLLSESGRYLAGSSEKNLSKRTKIVEEQNQSLAQAGRQIIDHNEGETYYTEDGVVYRVYYNTLELNGWKVFISVPESEVLRSVREMGYVLVGVCIVIVVVTGIMIVLQIQRIIKKINRVNNFVGKLAEGDFTVEPVHIKHNDEIGLMEEALNTMYAKNKGVLEQIAELSSNLEDSSRHLFGTVRKMQDQFRDIQNHMNEVNESMMTVGAATEEVTASAEEVLSNINILAGETDNSRQMVSEIRSRAISEGDNSRNAYDSAIQLASDFERKLQDTMEDAKVVENIGELATVISEIADQIDLLSLNASIEAAHAGEQGKGFAVVATEIGKLAKGTSEAVGRIQHTILDVQNAFDELSSAAEGILAFVKYTVTPDYDRFVGVAEQYGKDAESIASLTQNISDMSNNVKTIMTEVSDAIQSIAEASQNTADISSGIMLVVEEVTDDVKGISDMTEDNSSIAENLHNVVGRFKL